MTHRSQSLFHIALAVFALTLAAPAFAWQPPAAPMQAPSALPAPKQTPAQAPTQAPTQAAACTQTIMVPQTTYKTMTVSEMVCQPVVRQKTVNACRLVPQTQMATCRTTVLVPEQRTRPITYTACRMTYEDVARNVTVMVPHKETRQATRTICQLVQVQTTQNVTRDVGGWATKTFTDCCGCTHECQVWAPKLVTEQVPVTVCKPQLVEQPYSVEVVVCKPESRQFTQRVAKPVYETVTRNVTCTVAVPKIVEKQIPRTTFRPVVEQRVINVTEMVPTRVQRQVSVPVCTLVPKVVACPTPCCQ